MAGADLVLLGGAFRSAATVDFRRAVRLGVGVESLGVGLLFAGGASLGASVRPTFEAVGIEIVVFDARAVELAANRGREKAKTVATK